MCMRVYIYIYMNHIIYVCGGMQGHLLSRRLCCVSVHIYTYVYVYICIEFVYVCIYIYIYESYDVHMWWNARASTRSATVLCICTYMYICIYMYRVCVYVCIYTYINCMVYVMYVCCGMQGHLLAGWMRYACVRICTHDRVCVCIYI